MTENTITDIGLHNPPPPPLLVSRAMAFNSWRLGEGGGMDQLNHGIAPLVPSNWLLTHPHPPTHPFHNHCVPAPACFVHM